MCVCVGGGGIVLSCGVATYVTHSKHDPSFIVTRESMHAQHLREQSVLLGCHKSVQVQ